MKTTIQNAHTVANIGIVSILATSITLAATPIVVRPQIARMNESVVSVRGTGLRNDPFDPTNMIEVTKQMGSGFVVQAPSGAHYILTNNHVIDGAAHVFVGDVDTKVAFTDKELDVAVLLDVQKRIPAKLCAAEPELGTPVIAIGDPYGYKGSVSLGVVSGLHRSIPGLVMNDMLQTDALLNHGNSGGPLFDADKGCVLGMNTMIMTLPNGGSTGIGFAVPADILLYVVNNIGNESILTYHVPFQYMSDEDAEAIGFKGAVVTSVDSGVQLLGAYRDASGRPLIRDVIVGIDDRVVESATDLDRALYKLKGPYTLKVSRGEDIIHVLIE